jgi:hypothetical protein
VLGNIETQNDNPALYFAQLKGQGKINGFSAETDMQGHVAVFSVSKNSKATIEGGFADGLSTVEEISVGKGKFVYAIFKANDAFELNMLNHYIDEKRVDKPSFDFGITYFVREMAGAKYHCFTNLDKETRLVRFPKQISLASGVTVVLDENGEVLEL